MINIGLLLSQSYNDCWDDYMRSLEGKIPLWDYVVITASNESQAEAYRAQLASRTDFLPKGTEYLVIPDKNGKRIGSGGSTLLVIQELAKRQLATTPSNQNSKETVGFQPQSIPNTHSPLPEFAGRRILVIHSGGDSKRVPQYSALGKLFSPVPHELPDGRASTLFDELIITMSSMPGRIPEGMLLLSGDAQLLFNPLQIDWNGKDAAAISFKEDVETGKDHGVFLAPGTCNPAPENVKRFLHKQSEEKLRELGAVDERNRVNIDTGAVLFSTDILYSLYTLGDKFINDRVRLSLYGDFLYPMAEDSTLEDFFLEKPEGEYCEELTEARKEVWKALRPYRMKLFKLAPARFTHFGTTKEILHLMYEGLNEYKELAWSRVVNSSVPSLPPLTSFPLPLTPSAYCSIISPNAEIGTGCYFENAFVHDGVKIGDNVVLSYVNIEEGEIPSNVVVHGLKQKNGKFVCRIWGIDENPKDFWTEPRYPECDSMRKALAASLELYSTNPPWHPAPDTWHQTSLEESFNNADTSALLQWDEHMREAVIESLPLKEKLRKLWSLGRSEAAFKAISDAVLSTANPLPITHYPLPATSRNEVTVRLPLRVNFGGGWSDTPPYCLENGGTVLNAAILLNGEMPVEVRIEKLDEKKIIFESRDMGVYGEFNNLSEVSDTGDPFDPFALQKACLKSCGITTLAPGTWHLLPGFKINSEVTGIPKGSGLGTSSILCAACCKAILEFFGMDYTEEELISYVLRAEQIMSTGGGWQDQVGGLIPGVKLLTSEPGVDQQIKVEKLELSEETFAELNERFSVVYTGQRRLARYLLRDVIGRYISGETESLTAHIRIKELAVEMTEALKKDDVDAFASLLDEHWRYSKMIDAGSSNALIEQIFLSIDDLIDARMICGAGGGGFLQIIKKKGISDEAVHNRLKECFGDSNIDIWKTEIKKD